MTETERVNRFFEELEGLFRKYNLVIDCHADFISLLKDTKNNNKVICHLYDECSPDYMEPNNEPD